MGNIETNKAQKENIEAFRGMLIILALVFISIWSCSGEQETKEEEKPSFDPSVIYTISTEKGNGNDKSIDKYGVDGVKKINGLLHKAAELMASNPICDKLNIVSLSHKSTLNNILIYGHCINGERFNLSEQDINNNNPVKTDKEKMQATVPYLMTDCEKTIKSRLNYPSTYESSIWDSDSRVFDDRVMIEQIFTAKNAYNLELKYRAKCFFNDKQELTGFEMSEVR